jgi:hypothetical protein
MDENELDQNKLAEAIAWHLVNNFTPPQPPELLEYCLEALDACKAGDSERVITFPGGVTVTAGQLIDDLRLNDLLEA